MQSCQLSILFIKNIRNENISSFSFHFYSNFSQNNLKMKSAFRSTFFLLNIFGYQIFDSRKKFFALKFVQVIVLFVGILLFYNHRDEILYGKDNFGQFADRYRFCVSVFILVVMVLEPLLRYQNYENIFKLLESFKNVLGTKFKYQIDVSNYFDKLNRKLKFGVFLFLVTYFACEFAYFIHSLYGDSQSFLFYFSFLVPTILFDIKSFQLVFYMMLFRSQLDILTSLMENLNEEIADNQRLKSKVYDKIIRKKFHQIISMHQQVVEIIDNFNSSIGFSQLGIVLVLKFYLKGDFYWISFVFLHKRINNQSVFGELINNQS
jgi:hypothetical protein